MSLLADESIDRYIQSLATRIAHSHYLHTGQTLPPRDFHDLRARLAEGIHLTARNIIEKEKETHGRSA